MHTRARSVAATRLRACPTEVVAHSAKVGGAGVDPPRSRSNCAPVRIPRRLFGSSHVQNSTNAEGPRSAKHPYGRHAQTLPLVWADAIDGVRFQSPFVARRRKGRRRRSDERGSAAAAAEWVGGVGQRSSPTGGGIACACAKVTTAGPGNAAVKLGRRDRWPRLSYRRPLAGFRPRDNVIGLARTVARVRLAYAREKKRCLCDRRERTNRSAGSSPRT